MKVRFDRFVLDSDSRQLWCGESLRPLSPKEFDLLWLLIENRPRALSKAELHKRLWPDTFVSDATLSSLIAAVRGALQEHAHDGRCIRTVHRFGYAFGSDVTEVGGAERAASPVRCWIVWAHGQVALRDGTHLLGRDGDVAVWLESPTVSRHHARLRVSDGACTIEDLQSKNGTFVRGVPVTTEIGLADGDEIHLGSFAVVLRVAKSGSSTETWVQR